MISLLASEDTGSKTLKVPCDGKHSFVCGKTIHGKGCAMQKNSFGSIGWAIKKIQAGFLKGSPPGMSDCHRRAGYAARLLRQSHPEAEFSLWATPGKQIAHSLVRIGKSPIMDPRDRSVLTNLHLYRCVGRRSVASLADFLQKESPPIAEDPLDGIASRLLVQLRNPERVYRILDDALDQLLLSEVRAPVRGYGFSTKGTDRLLAEELINEGVAQEKVADPHMVFLSLTDSGRDLLRTRWDHQQDAGVIDDYDRGRRLLILERQAWPQNIHAEHPLRSRMWTDEGGRVFDPADRYQAAVDQKAPGTATPEATGSLPPAP